MDDAAFNLDNTNEYFESLAEFLCPQDRPRHDNEIDEPIGYASRYKEMHGDTHGLATAQPDPHLAQVRSEEQVDSRRRKAISSRTMTRTKKTSHRKSEATTSKHSGGKRDDDSSAEHLRLMERIA